MYAGTTIRRGSGKIAGVHQKIDRAARRHLKKFITKTVNFPNIKDILHFEGTNGPDGLKRKSPSTDSPWHFIDPSKPNDRELLIMIDDHIVNLSDALKTNNSVRAAFEAAWLAHAIVDGLTPSHHYPLNEKIEELWGKPRNERLTVMQKNIIRGINPRDTLSKNWEYWGAGGVWTKHFMFEWGTATSVATANYKDVIMNKRDITHLERVSFDEMFMKSLHKIDSLKMYEELGVNGWNQRLVRQTRNILVPEMIKMVTLAWYQASIMSGK